MESKCADVLRPIPEQIHPGDRDMLHLMQMRVLGGKTIENAEYRFFGKDDQVIWLSHTARPILKEGMVVQVQSSVRNINWRKELEIELAKYRLQMEEIVKKLTIELEAKNERAENFNSLFVGREFSREFRIKELKDQIQLLEEKLQKMENR